MEDEDIAVLVIICYLSILQHVNQNIQIISAAASAIT